MDELLLFLLGGLVGALVPAPFDVVHFVLQNHLYKTRFSRGWFEFLQFVDWYFVDSAYWGILIAVYYFFGLSNVSSVESWTTILSVLGVGAVIGVVGAFLFHRKRH